MTGGIRELLRFIAVVGVAIAILLGALLMNGCGASRPEVRPERRVTASLTLRSTALAVEALSALCPAPVPACPVVKSVGRKLSDGLRATARALEDRTPIERVGCVAPLVSKWLVAAIESRRDLPDDLVQRLDRALDWLPACTSD